MNKQTDPALIQGATDTLQQHGLKAVAQKRRPRAGVGPVLRVGQGRAAADYLVTARRTLAPATVGATVLQLRDQAAAAGLPTLLVADYLPPPVAGMLREQRQQFVDGAGNVYLEAPGLLVYVTGQKPATPAPARRAGPAATLTANGLKLVFALLCDPALAAAPQRTIAAAAGVALGAVPPVLAALQHAGHLLVAGRTRQLNATKRLLDEWALDYARRLRPKTLLATHTTPTFAAWRDWPINPPQLRWGGEPAAQLLVRHLNPGILTLYADKLPPRLVVEQKLRAAAPRETQAVVELRKPFWGQALQIDRKARTVPPVLVYADLLATGDARCIETAQMVYDQHLARRLPAA